MDVRIIHYLFSSIGQLQPCRHGKGCANKGHYLLQYGKRLVRVCMPYLVVCSREARGESLALSLRPLCLADLLDSLDHVKPSLQRAEEYSQVRELTLGVNCCACLGPLTQCNTLWTRAMTVWGLLQPYM